MGDLIQFTPRANSKSDRAFWIGQTEAEQREAILGIAGDLDHIAETVIVGALADNFIVPGLLADTAPAEYNYQAPTDDPA